MNLFESKINRIKEFSESEIFESNLKYLIEDDFQDKDSIKVFLENFSEEISNREDDLREFLEYELLNEWRTPDIKDNNINKNFKTLEDTIKIGGVCTFYYYNAYDDMPRGQYKKRGIEPYEICERKGRIFLSGYIFSLFTLSNNQPLWRTYLLSNMKDVRQIKRKYPRVVRPLWKGGTFKGAKVLVSISNYFKTSKVKGKTKDEVDANNELPDEKRVKNVYQKIKKSVYQPPNEDSEEGDFDD